MDKKFSGKCNQKNKIEGRVLAKILAMFISGFEWWL